MNKMRVYELAKKLGITNTQVLDILEKLGVTVKSHSSTVEDDTVGNVERFVKDMKHNGPSSTEMTSTPEKKEPTLPRSVPPKTLTAAPKTKTAEDRTGQPIRSEEKTAVPVVRKTQKAAEKPAEKAAEKPAEKAAEKPVEKAAEKPVEKAAEKVAEIPTERVTAGTALTCEQFALEHRVDLAKVVEFLWKQGEMVRANQPLNQHQQRILSSLGHLKPPISGTPPASIPRRRKESKAYPAPSNKGPSTIPGAQPKVKASAIAIKKKPIAVAPIAELFARSPVVTVLGHVDHGKTTLLDAIRKTTVAEKERGGITQKIGASNVVFNGQEIVFIDTPGHEAFTAMRAHGSQVTDIAILVVAADEGVMPQTVEALNHAKAAKVAIMVAVNKMDKEGANIDRVKQQLADISLIPEEWGGETIFIPISAKNGEGIDHLLEMILLLAELLELKAPRTGPAKGTVIEAHVDKGMGPIADVIVQEGFLRVGDYVQFGSTGGKIRIMLDVSGNRIKEAGPSAPVELIGLEEIPLPGETFEAVKEYRSIKQLGAKASNPLARKTAENILHDTSFDKLNLIFKADTQGSLDAIRVALRRIPAPEIQMEPIHFGVGAISESDINLASITHSIVFGFSVRADAMAKKAAGKEKVDVRTFDLIYELITDLESCLRGKCEPRLEEKPLGEAVVRQVFRITKLGLIAGSYVQEGKVVRNAKARIIRNNIVVGETKVTSLKRFKEDVREVLTSFECGIGLEKNTDLQVGDILEIYVIEEVQP
jgi:translation initiation factor IF-2